MLDVKVGNGAFMKSLSDARMLAESMQEPGRRAGRQVVALLTDMNQPLGWAIGNAIEIEEVPTACSSVWRLHQTCSRSQSRPRGGSLPFPTSASMPNEGAKRAEKAIDDGSAAETFERWIAAQGGDLSSRIAEGSGHA